MTGMRRFAAAGGLFVLLVLAGSLPVSAQNPNLIVNSDFDKPLDRECRFDAAPGTIGMQIFTEDRTWNRCLKVGLLRYAGNKDGKAVNASVRIGGNERDPGFPVKPNTIYSYSLEVKGNWKGKVCAWNWKGSDYWKDAKRIEKIRGQTSFEPGGEWTVVKGTFQTGADAKYAAIGIVLWGEERYKNLPAIGSYVLLDNVRVSEKSDLLDSAKKDSAPSYSVQLKKAVVPGRTVTGFVKLKTGEKPDADTEFEVLPGDDGITLNITCFEPRMSELKADISGCGGKVWRDDVLEIFFGPVVNDRTLSQFAVSAGGGRWMGRGGGTETDMADYEKWSAEVTRGEDRWTAKVGIPYELLGWQGKPDRASVIPFNLCRTRKPVSELSSYSFASNSFHDVKEYALFWLSDPKIWFAREKDELIRQAEPLRKKDLSDRIADWQLTDPAESYRQAMIFRKEIESARLGSRTFAVTPVSPSSDPAIPMIPAELAELPDRVRIRAAVNEFKALPLAVTNLLDRPEEYRIVIAAVNGNTEESGLKRQDGTLFPPEKLKLYRGIRVKDGDGENHGFRYDPLAPMDITSTVVVMPKEAAPVWAVFDTAGVPPGVYSGVIRVIPLGQAGIREKDKWKYAMADLPLEFEVLPFEISRAPAIPQFFFGAAFGGRETFRMMMEHDINAMLINPWRIKASFEPDGSLKSADISEPEEEIRNLQEYAREMGMEKELRIGFVYSAYLIFRDVHSRKQFKWGTPEWKKAWQEYVKLMDSLRKKCGIPAESCFVEIQDEPKAEEMAELIAAAEAACEAAPDLNLMLTVASWDLPRKDMQALAPYIHHWCFWGTKYFGREYAPFLDELRRAGKKIALYSCDTSLRLDLQKYYLTHAWRALACGMDMCCLYEFMTYRYASADWKQTPYGSTALMASGKPVSTIRLECLRIGSTDIKYMKKLADLLKDPANRDHPQREEIGKFLRDAPKQVGITMAHDPKISAQTREKAIDYILLLLQKKP